MIYTDVEYQNTIKTAEKFRSAIKEMSQIPATEIGDSDVHEVQIDSHKQLLIQLDEQIAEYKLAKSTDERITVTSLSDLGISLVKARIKAGLDREDLADQLSVNVSQIKSRELDFYSAISVEEIRKTAKILDVEIPDEVLPSQFNGKIRGILAKLKKVGLAREFIESRLITSHKSIYPAKELDFDLNDYTIKLCIYLKRVFGWTIDELISSEPLTVPAVDLGMEKFKDQSNRKLEKITVYSKYAHHLAIVAARSATILDKKAIPTDPVKMRKAIIDEYGSIDLQNVVSFAWDCGVIVLPLNDKGYSYGGCKRIDGRNVIILNPREKFTSYWLFDLLHKLYHAGQEPEKESFEKIVGEVTAQERWLSQEDKDANNYAGEVIFGGNADKLFKQCIASANNSAPLLKKALSRVANENDVMVGALAYYVAYRLGKKFPKLRAVARNMQSTGENSYSLTRGILIERLPFYIEDQFDKELFFQAFEGEH